MSEGEMRAKPEHKSGGNIYSYWLFKKKDKDKEFI